MITQGVAMLVAGTVLAGCTAAPGMPAVRPPHFVVVQATGVGHPPKGAPMGRSRLMAKRAAEVVAARNLALKIDPTGRTNVPPFRYLSTKYLADGSVEVTVEARLPSTGPTRAAPRRGP